MFPIRLVVVSVALFGCTAPAMAQGLPPNLATKMYVECVSDATSRGNISREGDRIGMKNGRSIVFQCSGMPAKRLFDFLVARGLPTKRQQTRQGLAVMVDTELSPPPDRMDFCINIVAKPDATPFNGHSCYLRMNAGAVLD